MSTPQPCRPQHRKIQIPDEQKHLPIKDGLPDTYVSTIPGKGLVSATAAGTTSLLLPLTATVGVGLVVALTRLAMIISQTGGLMAEGVLGVIISPDELP
jgi:hypothetical protein